MDAQNWQQQNQQGNFMGAQDGQQQNQQGDFMGAQNQQGNFMGAQNWQQQNQQGNFMGAQNWQQQNQQASFPVMNGGIQVPHPEQRHQGEIIKKGEKYGFIKPDDGSPDMFVLPGSCAAFGGVVPEIGTQLTYTIAVEK